MHKNNKPIFYVFQWLFYWYHRNRISVKQPLKCTKIINLKFRKFSFTKENLRKHKPLMHKVEEYGPSF